MAKTSRPPVEGPVYWMVPAMPVGGVVGVGGRGVCVGGGGAVGVVSAGAA